MAWALAQTHLMGHRRLLAFSTLVAVIGWLGCDVEDAPDAGVPVADASAADSSMGAADAAGTDASTTDDAGMVVIPPGLLHFDDFEYDVARDVAGASELFQAHGWAGAKTVQDGQAGARGHVYTTATVPGYDGPLPGSSSSRVLVLEALPASLAGQTDFYVQWGSGEGPIGQLPPNHWFQFWVYSPDDPDRNQFTQGKFIYPNRAPFYPATLGNEGYVYIATLGKRSGQTLGIDCDPARAVPCDEAFFQTVWNSEGGLTNRQPDGSGGLDQNLTDAAPVTPGQWTLVRIHVDVSGTDPRAAPGHAVYEQWIRRRGDAEWTKTTEWIGGVTVNPSAPSSEPVDLRPAYADGFRMFRMPTTVGGTNASIGDWYDYRIYVDDFAVAGSEDDLPAYP